MTGQTSAEREECVRFVAVAGLIASVLFVVIFGAHLRGSFPLPLDARGIPLGRDFVNTWLYGHAFFDPHPGRFYDRPTYEQALQALLPQNTAAHLWSYAPTFLMVAAPFGLLPYPVALALWTVLSLVALGFATRMHGSHWLVVAVLTSPMTLFAVVAGQVSVFAAALILVVFRELDRRPVIAGLALALLSLKPQPFILVPIFLLASRRWKVFAVATSGTLALVALSMAMNGVDTWVSFLRLGLPAQALEMRDTLDLLMPFSATLTTEAHEAGLPDLAVQALQALGAVVAAALVASVGLRSRRNGRATREYEGLVVLAASVLATPYLLLHDLVALSAFLTIVAYREGLIRNRSVLLVMLYAPVLQIALGQIEIHVLATVVAAFAIWLTERGDGRAAAAAPARPPLAGALTP